MEFKGGRMNIEEQESRLIYRLHREFPETPIVYSEMDHGMTHILYIGYEEDIQYYNTKISGIVYDVEDNKRINIEKVGFSLGKTEDEMFNLIVNEYRK